jgi:hypothetical protein
LNVRLDVFKDIFAKVEFVAFWSYNTPSNGQQTWCGMDISFVQAEDETYFFASDLTNLKEYQWITKLLMRMNKKESNKPAE